MIRNLMQELQFPVDAIDAIGATFDTLLAHPEGQARLDALAEEVYHGKGREYLVPIEEMATSCGVHCYSADMAAMLYVALSLREIYREQGLADEIFLNSMGDFRCKLMECKTVKGVWGTFVGWWYHEFFRLARFGLGRLQYEKVPFRCEEYHGIKKGDIVFNCHIPSSGPLLREEVIDSLKKAHAFYRDELKDGIFILVCSSWLLYPPMYEVFPENGNLRKFYELFDVIEAKEVEPELSLWRIFGVEQTPIKDLPENSSLQRRLKQHLLQGGTMGSGYGVLLFDGEKILKMS